LERKKSVVRTFIVSCEKKERERMKGVRMTAKGRKERD
jgi:hypothetical protein